MIPLIFYLNTFVFTYILINKCIYDWFTIICYDVTITAFVIINDCIIRWQVFNYIAICCVCLLQPALNNNNNTHIFREAVPNIVTSLWRRVVLLECHTTYWYCLFVIIITIIIIKYPVIHLSKWQSWSINDIQTYRNGCHMHLFTALVCFLSILIYNFAILKESNSCKYIATVVTLQVESNHVSFNILPRWYTKT